MLPGFVTARNIQDIKRKHFGTIPFTGEYPFTGGYLLPTEETIFTMVEKTLMYLLAVSNSGDTAVGGIAPAWTLILTPMLAEEIVQKVVGLVLEEGEAMTLISPFLLVPLKEAV